MRHNKTISYAMTGTTMQSSQQQFPIVFSVH